MTSQFVSTFDQAVLSAALRETLDRLLKIKMANSSDPPVAAPIADWLAIYDALDRILDNFQAVRRPAPRPLIDAYRRTRTWLKEFHPRLRNNTSDQYGRRQLDTVIKGLDRELTQYGDS